MPHVVDAITDSDNVVFVSAASAWEIAIKRNIGKLGCGDDLREVIEDRDFTELPITFQHALAAGKLPRHHKDPFDRMLVAQAIVEDLVLITQDNQIGQYEVNIMQNK